VVIPHVELNGEPVDSVDVELLRSAAYGHFTSMQVRDRRVRGLGLHLDRLDAATHELFGGGLPADRVLAHLRSALQRSGARDASVRVLAVHGSARPDVLVTVSDPIAPTATPPRLLAVEHERAAPHLKHTGTFALVYFGRQAEAAGFDDAIFVDRAGRISEATIWNVCFAAGDRIVWPQAAALPGIAMLSLQQGLAATGVRSETRPIPLAELGSYDAAYLTNSIDPALPIASITTGEDTVTYPPHPASAATIAAASAAVPLDEI
jgi:branched-subunit amino acid aminotransferase/4-amino-4-deoxychorismate lyase